MRKKTTIKQLLRLFVGEDYGRAEYRKVVALFADDHDDELKEQLQDHWNGIPADQPLNERLAGLLKNLKQQNRSSFARRKTPWINYFQKVAAILFIPLLLGYGIWFIQSKDTGSDAMATIHSPEGARTEFVLPDGTKGWLNSGSRLSYPVMFTKNREVKLSGEAYFEVVRDQNKKFRVKTNELTVQVLGTSFSVTAYDDDQKVSVVLKEGRVKVLSPDNQLAYEMKPNEELSYDLYHKSANVRQVSAEEMTSWIDGILRFKGEPLSEVIKKLARWYGVDFEIKDQQLQDYNFQATFKDEQLDEILRMIALTTPMKYQIEERKQNKNGIYMKKKIVIDKN